MTKIPDFQTAYKVSYFFCYNDEFDGILYDGIDGILHT